MVKHCSKISCYSEKSPQFFKIYFPRHCSQRLRIPPAFLKYFNGVIPFKSILRSPAKRSLQVDVNKVGNSFYFLKGWQEFAQVNSLKFGDFLIFSYNGNSEFHISIFGKNNCQKQLLLLQRNQTVEPCKDNELTCRYRGEMDTRTNVHSRRPEPIQENIEALQTPCKFESKNPFFESVLRPAYARNGFMNIPAEFVKSYINMCAARRTARLEHSNKSWVVTMVCNRNKLLFSSGWRKFVEDNTLQEGDVCSFELIKRDDCVFNVAFRKEQSTKSTQPQNGEQVAEMSLHPGDPLENQENEGALDDSGKFISKHPFFQIVLSPRLRGSLNIPAEFRHRHMYKRRASARLQHSNKWWPMKLMGDGRRSLYFSAGWVKFLKENTLQAGDICRFELIESINKYVFNVFITRGNNNGTPTKA